MDFGGRALLRIRMAADVDTLNGATDGPDPNGSGDAAGRLARAHELGCSRCMPQTAYFGFGGRSHENSVTDRAWPWGAISRICA